MVVFENCSILLDVKNLSVKEKKNLKSAVTENGGNISYVVNKECSLVVSSDVSSLSSSRRRSIQRLQTPVVGPDYVFMCVERGALLPVEEHRLDTSSSSSSSSSSAPHPPQPPPRQKPNTWEDLTLPVVSSIRLGDKTAQTIRGLHQGFRTFTEADPDLPSFPDNFQVAKYSIFEKKNGGSVFCALELHSAKGEEGRQYRVVRYWKEEQKASLRDKLVFPQTSEEALQVYQKLSDDLEASGFQKKKKKNGLPPQAQDLGSAPLQQLLLEEKLNAASVSQEVGVLVELLWTEALGSISSILTVPVHKLSLHDVSRAEGLLLQAQKRLKEQEDPSEVTTLLGEVYALLPHREPQLLPTARLLSQKLDLCQLIRDVLNMSEVTLRSPAPSCLGKYRALRCSIEMVPPSSSEFQDVINLLQISQVQIQQVVRVSRGVELQTFNNQIGNVQTLLHSSGPSNFVGILSRGLLLPRVGVEDHGITRTDVGHLGSGIYFTNALSSCLKYSKPSVTDGSRLLLVCDVALGRIKNVQKKNVTLTRAPDEHDSVRGVSRNTQPGSEFEDDEFVVYSPDQVRIRYVVQFSLEGDRLKDFRPDVNLQPETCLPPAGPDVSLDDDGIENIKNPLEDVTAGLLDSSGQQLPLQAVHVKCKLMDLLSQVIIFQKYTNQSSVPIEAKYVFPLDDSAAVCGFEAFINGKHVVGQVKEKEKARQEYKQAIEKGHGAYLMDQDAPDVFTISVGNLPPGATVLIKVTFVSELVVRDGRILFSLPGSVAPWQEKEALNQTTQVTVEKVCVTDDTTSMREFSLDLSVEMPHEICSLECITHKVKIKRTDCKAVVSLLPGEVLGPDGFHLSVGLSEVHLPRMWVEKHPDKDSQACMLVFYPDFDVSSCSDSDEVVLLLDTSESMRGQSLVWAQKICLQVLRKLNRNLRVNVILFGTDHTDAFLTAEPLTDVHQEAEEFIKTSPAVGGSTELWRPLQALSLLPPSDGVRNLLLLSDGHIQNAELTLRLVRETTPHSRMFTCGLSPTANRHMLRALAQAGGGAYEFFDTKTKHNWAEKVSRQVKRLSSPGCSSVSVKWQQFNPTAPPPVQAPQQLHALFNDTHTLVYGFVPHCTQATLLGNLSGQELNTMVSTSELQKTRGTFLHKLTARALIRDYEDGNLDMGEAEHEGKKAELKNFIIDLSKEFSILSQFTSFVAIEERDSDEAEDGFTDVPKLIAQEDVDFLPYISWDVTEEEEEEEEEEKEEEEDMDHIFDFCSGDIEPREMMMCCDFDTEDVFGTSDREMEDDSSASDAFGEPARYETSLFTADGDDAPVVDVVACSLSMDVDDHMRFDGVLQRATCVENLLSSSDESDDDMGFGLFSDDDEAAAPAPPPPPAPPKAAASMLHAHQTSHEPPPPPPSVRFFRTMRDGRVRRGAAPPPPAAPPPVVDDRSRPVFRSLAEPAAFSEPLSDFCNAAPPPPPPPPAPPANAAPPSLSRPFGIPPLRGGGDLLSEEPVSFVSEGSRERPAPPASPHQREGGRLRRALRARDHDAPSRVSSVKQKASMKVAEPKNLAAFFLKKPAEEPPPDFSVAAPSSGAAEIFLKKSAPAQESLYGSAVAAPSSASDNVFMKKSARRRRSKFSGPSRRSPSLDAPSPDLDEPSPASDKAFPPLPAAADAPPKPFSFAHRPPSVQAGGGLLPRSYASVASGEGSAPPALSPMELAKYKQKFICLASPDGPPEVSLDGFGAPSPGPRFDGFSSAAPPPGFGPSPFVPVPCSASSSGYGPPSPASRFGAPSSASAAPSPYIIPCLAPSPGPRFGAPFSGLTAPPSSSAAPSFGFGGSSRFAAPSPGLCFGAPPSGPASAAPSSSLFPATPLLFSSSASFGSSSGASGPQMFRPQIQQQQQRYAASSPIIMFGRPSSNLFGQSLQTAARPEDPKIKWTKIFQMQRLEGFWEFSVELGQYLNVNVDLFANVFLKSKGISSLGVKAHADILRLVATLLVLQLMREEKLEEGKLLRTLFSLEDPAGPRPGRWVSVRLAVDWVSWADRMYPSIYSRLEFGWSWESSTRQLLGFDSLPPSSPLSGLELRRRTAPLLVN